jgi:tetratricopeptide (TPR) repeat protein
VLDSALSKRIKLITISFLFWLPLIAVAQDTALLAAIQKAQEFRDKDPKNVLSVLSPFSSDLTGLSWDSRLLYQRTLIDAKSDLGDYSAALKDASRALGSTPQQYFANTDYLAILYKKVFFQLQLRDIAGATKDNKRLLTLGEQHGDLPSQVQAHLNNELFALYEGEWQQALAHVQRAYRLVSEEDWYRFSEVHGYLIGKVKYELARLYRNIRPQEARRLLSEALELDEAAGNKSTAMSDLNHLAILALQQKDYAAAFNYAKRIEQYALELNKRSMLMSSYTMLSQLHLLQNDVAQADLLLRKAALHRLSVQSNNVMSRFILQRARLFLKQEQFGKAVEALEGDKDLFFRKQEPLLTVEYYGLLSESLAGLGRVSEAYEVEKLRLAHYKSLQETQHVRLVQALAVQFEQERTALKKQVSNSEEQLLAQLQDSFFSWRNLWVLAILQIALLLFILRNLIRAKKFSQRLQSKYRGEMMPPCLTLKRLQHALDKAVAQENSLLVILLSNKHRWFERNYFQGVSLVLQKTMPKGSVWGRLGEGQVLVAVPANAERVETVPALLRHRLRADRRRVQVRQVVSAGEDNIEALLTRLMETNQE